MAGTFRNQRKSARRRSRQKVSIHSDTDDDEVLAESSTNTAATAPR